MVIAGAFADPVDGAMFVFKGATVVEIETYAKVSPFVREGVRSVSLVERSLADTTPFPFDPSSMDGCARVQTDPVRHRRPRHVVEDQGVRARAAIWMTTMR